MKLKKSNVKNQIVIIGEMNSGDIIECRQLEDTTHKVAIIIDHFYSNLNHIKNSDDVADSLYSVFNHYLDFLELSQEDHDLFENCLDDIYDYLIELVPLDHNSSQFANKIKSIKIIVDNELYDLNYDKNDVVQALHDIVNLIQ